MISVLRFAAVVTSWPVHPRHQALGQIADGAGGRLTRPHRIGLKSSAACPGHCAVVLADGTRLVLPGTPPVAVLRQPIALEAVAMCGAVGGPGSLVRIAGEGGIHVGGA